MVFSVWLLFFDDRDIITTHFKHRNELKQLEQSRDYYLQQIETTKKELDNLKQIQRLFIPFHRILPSYPISCTIRET
jgi:hypothetical protein